MPEYTDDPNYGDTSDGANDNQTLNLTAGLPSYLPRARGTGNYNLLWAIASQLNEAEHDIESVDFAQNPQNAETIEQLQKLGELVETPLNENETKEHYRGRLLARGMVATSEGTIDDIISGAAEILDVNKESVNYEEPIAGSTENGTASVTLPNEALDEQSLTAGEVASFLEDLAPAGVRLSSLTSGTFTYITPTEYNNSNHDSTKGYDGLDGNGDPKDNGGTYAGII